MKYNRTIIIGNLDNTSQGAFIKGTTWECPDGSYPNNFKGLITQEELEEAAQFFGCIRVTKDYWGNPAPGVFSAIVFLETREKYDIGVLNARVTQDITAEVVDDQG